MSKFLTNAAVQEFDSEVKHEYQGMGKLRNTVTIRTGVVGDQYKFVRMGKGIANQKASSADVTPMDITHNRQVAFLNNWNAPEYTDIFDQAEVNYSEKTELARTIAYGLRRREDQVIIDAISGISFVTTNDQDPDTGLTFDDSASTNFGMLYLHRARRHYQELETEATLHCMCTATALQSLLVSTKVGSVDYNLAKPLVEGDLSKKFMGFQFHVIGNRAEGGIPAGTVPATDEYAFTWAEDAVGLAIGIDMKTEINYIAQKTSWLCNGLLKLGAVAREAQGIVRLQYNPATAPTA
jgi:hypothetical protein